jgi:two-component system, OmpR family, flagellar system response regulator FtcR
METSMFVVVDDREAVTQAFVTLFKREGIAAIGLCSSDLRGWIASVSESDLSAVEAFLLGQSDDPARICRFVAGRSRAAIVAMSEARVLDETLTLFAAGVDDVVRKPVHVKEIVARVSAVSRRSRPRAENPQSGAIKVFLDGRDPVVGGDTLMLPRRERRILEYMARNMGCRVTKGQIFGSVYGLFNEEYDENIIESQIRKLRKRLRERLGYDPIDSMRFLGYRLTNPQEVEVVGSAGQASRSGQGSGREMEHEPQLVQG